MEHPRHHEFIRPAREIVQFVIDHVVNWAVPSSSLEIQNESARRTAPQLPRESFEE